MADKICRDLGFAYRYPNPDDMLEKRSDFLTALFKDSLTITTMKEIKYVKYDSATFT